MNDNCAPCATQSESMHATNTDFKAKPKCLVLCTGHMATIRIPELVAELSTAVEVAVLCTEKAKFILRKTKLCDNRAWDRFQECGGWTIVLDKEILRELSDDSDRSALHALLYSWADVLIVAPASANVIAKSSYGIADNFVLSVMRAWDFRKPCILCPAMNTVMWTHPSMLESLSRLQTWGWMVLEPKRPGMASVHNIRKCLFRALGIPDQRGQQLSTHVVRKCFFKYKLKKLHGRKKVLVKYHTAAHSVQTGGLGKEKTECSGLVTKKNSWKVLYLNTSFYVGIATGWWLTGKALSYAIQYALSSSSGYDI